MAGRVAPQPEWQIRSPRARGAVPRHISGADLMLDDFSQHPASPYFAYACGELLIAGQPVSAIAAQAGRTPVYCYDGWVMGRKVAEFRAAMPTDVERHYAIKENPLPSVVAHLASLADGLDVA